MFKLWVVGGIVVELVEVVVEEHPEIMIVETAAIPTSLLRIPVFFLLT